MVEFNKQILNQTEYIIVLNIQISRLSRNDDWLILLGRQICHTEIGNKRIIKNGIHDHTVYGKKMQEVPCINKVAAQNFNDLKRTPSSYKVSQVPQVIENVLLLKRCRFCSYRSGRYFGWFNCRWLNCRFAGRLLLIKSITMTITCIQWWNSTNKSWIKHSTSQYWIFKYHDYHKTMTGSFF